MIEIKLLENKAIAVDKNLDKEVGVCEFTLKENVCNIYHTELNSLYRGQNIAKKLVECVISFCNEKGIKIEASCSYADKILALKKIK